MYSKSLTRLSVSEPSNASRGADDSRVAGCLVPEASVWFIKGFHFLFRCKCSTLIWLTKYHDA